MAPERSASPPARRRRAENRENQYIFELGVRGRKTGVTLPDTGIRDEHGLEPMDDLFSPDKPESVAPSRSNGNRRNANEDATISSEEDMEVDENTAPEPADVLSQRRHDARLSMPLPRSKSPLKTHLLSPARRHPSLGVPSSPGRGESSDNETGPVRRKLDFQAEDAGNSVPRKTNNGNSRGRGRPALSKLTNGTRLSPGRRSPPQVFSDDDEEEEPVLENDEESVQYIAEEEEDDANLEDVEGISVPEEEYEEEAEEEQGQEEIEQVVESEPEPEPEPELPKKPLGKNKGKGKAVEETEPPAPKRRGRKPKNSDPPIAVAEEVIEEEVVDEEVEDERPKKKARHSPEVTKPRARGRPSNPTKSKPAPIAKSKSKAKSKMAPILEVDSPQLQRGPPIPRTKGLFIYRHETPTAGTGFQRTKSGRNSMKPLAYWKNERVEYDESETALHGKNKILLPSIKGVVRAEDVEQAKSSRPRGPKPKGKSKKRRRDDEDDEEDYEYEEWELVDGRIHAEVRSYDPDDQVGDLTEERVEEVAFSSKAIKTRPIEHATFKFAKTLTLPFFGSGMVDLEPGTMKKPKNSRKMQMVFFVFYGRVEVTVNGTAFRISKGGMWQVPRGNFYSITNDYDEPARIFFAQGCEYSEADAAAALAKAEATAGQ